MNTANDDEVGKEVANGRYQILAHVGQGSMGHVYRAFDRHLETDVVIKFPLPGEVAEGGEGQLERFHREVRSLVRFSHPNVVRVIDVGIEGGRPYVVLEYLAGGSLKDRIRSGPNGEPVSMHPTSLRWWLPAVARALDFLHAQGHIHRDVKPANILFDGHGNAFLADFGIIKALATEARDAWQDSSLTAPGFLLGTPSYIAPELVMGQAGDGRSDEYSLALTIFEALTGYNVMAGPTPSATLVNQTKVEPPPLTELAPGLPRRLSDAVLRGLAKDPARRYQNCSDLAREVLAAAEADGTATAFRPGRTGPTDSSFELGTLGPGTSSTVTAPYPKESPGSGTFAGSTAGRSRPRRPTVAAAAIALVLLVAAAAWLLARPAGAPRGPAKGVAPPAEVVEVNIAYGTEKKKWLEDALREYNETPAGRRARIRLIGMGSVEGAKAILDGPGPTPIHVWSPASSVYRDAFERRWIARRSGRPIARAEDLALTPMVFVMWRSRHDAFVKKYGRVSFRALGEAMGVPDGWGTIAGRPEWGLFKFGHTDPSQSNSGLVALVLLAYGRSGKQRGLTVDDITRPAFREWLTSFERGVTRHGGSLTHSTGTLMEEMIKRGPSQYDGLLVYENLAIDYMKQARERWGDQGELYVSYPDPNLWNEHPYYILDVPWSGPKQRAAAADFLAFLMSEPVQRRALDHGFRPGNPSVPVTLPDSPLVKNRKSGLRIDVPRICEPPRADVVDGLLSSFGHIEP